LAQYDLAKFFRKLSEENQLIYTSHSPFLVDMDNLSNVKAIYLDKKTGRSKVSSDLRLSNEDADKSVFPVHAALGLTVSDTFLLGCFPVLVEGPSDRIYMTLIKRFLNFKGLLKASKEIVFIPTGGIKGMKPIIRLVSSRENKLPIVFLDSDRIGKEFKNVLQKDIYKDDAQRVLEVGEFIKGEPFEIEDLMPSNSLVEIIDRTILASKYFSDFYKVGIPIVDQVIAWAQQVSVSLPDGWKVELARKCINQFERLIQQVDEKHSAVWEQLFSEMLKRGI
jgi:predicted ATP-dependent endonuclease of OLD family